MPLFSKHSSRPNKPASLSTDPAVVAPSQGDLSSPIAGLGDRPLHQPQSFHPPQPRVEQPPFPPPQAIGLAVELDRPYQIAGAAPGRSSQSSRFQSSQEQLLSQAGTTSNSSSTTTTTTNATSLDDISIDTRRPQQHPQGPRSRPQSVVHLQSPAAEQKKSKSIFDRMRSGSSRAEPPPPSRKLSKRREEPPAIRTSQPNISLDQRDWQEDTRSSQYLESPQESQEGVFEEPLEGSDPYTRDETDPRFVHQEQSSQLQQQQQQSFRPVADDLDLSSNPAIDHRQHYQHQRGASLGGQAPQPYYDPPPPIQHQQQQHQQQQIYEPEEPSQLEVPPPQQSHYYPQHVNPPHSDTLQVGNLQVGNALYRQPTPETVSQLSFEVPGQELREEPARPVSQQSNSNRHSPTPTYPQRTTSQRPLSQYNNSGMAPSTPASQTNRRNGDTKQNMQGAQGQQPSQGPPDSRDGSQAQYRQQFPNVPTPTTSGGPAVSPGPAVVNNTQGANYRGGPPQRDQFGASGGGEQGRSTPPPAPAERDVNDAYKELLQKYKKVKGLYFDKTSQVENLQNTLANQRLSQSRTSLDDSEYTNRFNRLDGAVTNLAFNIRRDWRQVPSWIAPYVNQEAVKIGKGEMTAVGRACITRYLVDEIFNRTFLPSLETDLSIHLKNIEQNLRRYSPIINSQEESDALTAKVVQWRLSTLEGLREVLAGPESEMHRQDFQVLATSNLTALLINFLSDPPPPGLQESAHMIVELAVSIASNLPLESRDINIIYPMPGDLVQPFFMKLESRGDMPQLENPGMDSEMDGSSTTSMDKEETPKEAEKAEGKLRKKDAKSGGMLQAMMGGGSAGSSAKSKSATTPQSSTEGPGDGGKGKTSLDDGHVKVRFAGFVGIEVRGRTVLTKAPVWTMN